MARQNYKREPLAVWEQTGTKLSKTPHGSRRILHARAMTCGELRLLMIY